MIKIDDMCDIELHYHSIATIDELRDALLKSKLFEEQPNCPKGNFYPIEEKFYFVKLTKANKNNKNETKTLVMIYGVDLSSTDVPEIVNNVEKIIKFAEY